MSSSEFYLPNILLNMARNPMSAVGIPTVVGCYIGWPGEKTFQSAWWKTLKVYPYPPGRVLPVVLWIANYAAVGYASHLAVNALDQAVNASARHDLSLGLVLYYTHLALSFAYTPILLTQDLTTSTLDSFIMTGVTFAFSKILNEATNGETSKYLIPYCAWSVYVSWRALGLWHCN